MKILLLNYKYSVTGGSEQYFIFQVKQLKQAGHTVIVICSDENRISVKGVKCYYIKDLNKITATIKNLIKIKRIIDREKFDGAYIHNNDNPFLNYYISSKLPSVKFIHSYDHICPITSKYIFNDHSVCSNVRGLICFKHCLNFNVRNVYLLCKNFIEPRAYKNYKKLVVFSDLVKNKYEKVYDNEIVKFTYYSEHQNEVHEKNIKGKNILFVGRLIRSKGIYELIDICAQIKSDYVLWVVGDGPELDQFNEYAKAKNIHYKMFGWLDNKGIKDMYAQAAVLAVPSIWPEPFGIIGLEAMSFKVPIVGFDNGGISEWLKDGYNGYIIPDNSKELFTEKLEFFLKNEYESKKMGQNGYTFLIDKFSIDRSKDFFLKMVYDIFHKRS